MLEQILRAPLPQNWSLQNLWGAVITVVSFGSAVLGIGFDIDAIQAAWEQMWTAGAALWGLIIGPFMIWLRLIVTTPLVGGLKGLFIKKEGPPR